MRKPILDQLDPQLFTWSRWRAGAPIDILGIRGWDVFFITYKKLLRMYAIGYCNGSSLVCRPKPNHYAVMFFKNGRHGWFHMSENSFNEVFIDET